MLSLLHALEIQCWWLFFADYELESVGFVPPALTEKIQKLYVYNTFQSNVFVAYCVLQYLKLNNHMLEDPRLSENTIKQIKLKNKIKSWETTYVLKNYIEL